MAQGKKADPAKKTEEKQAEEQPQQKRCFVVGPIGEEGSETRRNADWLLEGIIRPVLEEHGYLVTRADKITKPGNIDTQVINEVIEAELVVADLSEHNANAFYELGLRHMSKDKPVIHMIRKGDKIPFDNNTYRTIVFDHLSIQGLERAKANLELQVLEIKKPDFKVETPVTRARHLQGVSFDDFSPDEVITDEIKSLMQRVSRIEDGLSSTNKVFLNKEYIKVFVSEGSHVIGEFEVLYMPNMSVFSFLRSLSSNLLIKRLGSLGQSWSLWKHLNGNYYFVEEFIVDEDFSSNVESVSLIDKGIRFGDDLYLSKT